MYCLWFENLADFKSYGRAEMVCWEVENTIAFYCYNCHLKIKQSAFIQQQYVTKKQVCYTWHVTLWDSRSISKSSQKF